MQTQRKKVGMSFNAGGVRGYFSALIVQQIEQDLNMQLNQFVDVFSGVSIGSILSTLYAIGVPSSTVVKLFEDRGQEIFKPKFYYKWGVVPIKGPRYCSESLENLIVQYTGDMKLKDVQPALLSLATDVTDGKYPFGKVFSNIYEDQQELLLKDIVLCSSAAPSYFKQQQINNRSYIDGGISDCDSSMQCLSGLIRKTDNIFDNSILVNVGTGIYKGDGKQDESSKWNQYYLINGLNISLSACQSLTSFTAGQLYFGTNNYHSLDTDLSNNIELDDLTALPQLKKLAQQFIDSDSYKQCLQQLQQNIVPQKNDNQKVTKGQLKSCYCSSDSNDENIVLFESLNLPQVSQRYQCLPQDDNDIIESKSSDTMDLNNSRNGDQSEEESPSLDYSLSLQEDNYLYNLYNLYDF